MKKYLLPSLILAAINFTPILFYNTDTGMDMAPRYIRWGSFVLTLIVFFLVVRKYKTDYSAGSISFKKAFNYALKVSLCMAVMSAVVFFVYVNYIDNSYLKNIGTLMRKQQEIAAETGGLQSASSEKLATSGKVLSA